MRGNPLRKDAVSSHEDRRIAPLSHNADSELMRRTVESLRVPHKAGATDSVRTEYALIAVAFAAAMA